MKKTLTAALALTAIAGIAFADKATVDSQFAGCLSFTGTASEQLVCSPFEAFEGGHTPKLGDFSGESDATICVIAPSGKRLFTVVWVDSGTKHGWYADSSATVSSNDYPLVRGTSILFSRSGSKLTFSGTLAASEDVEKQLSAGTYAPVGNVSVSSTAKKLKDFKLEGCDPTRDYVIISGQKYVYANSKWYLRSDFLSNGTLDDKGETVSIPAGGGVAVVCGTAGRGQTRGELSITVPGKY